MVISDNLFHLNRVCIDRQRHATPIIERMIDYVSCVQVQMKGMKVQELKVQMIRKLIQLNILSIPLSTLSPYLHAVLVKKIKLAKKLVTVKYGLEI